MKDGNDRVLIGKITSPSGLQGEVRVYSYAERKERFSGLDFVYIDGKKTGIERCRFVKNMVVLKLSGTDSIEQAESLRSKEVYMDADDLPELEDGEYYIRDLIGFEVERDNGTELGTLGDVLTDGPQDIFVAVNEEGKEILIPNVPAFVKKIDPENGRISVSLIPGMEEL